jgi:hypothetical protein
VDYSRRVRELLPENFDQNAPRSSMTMNMQL